MSNRTYVQMIPLPRLLPLTILAMAALLVMKSVTVVLAATAGAIPTAKAEAAHVPAELPVKPAPGKTDAHSDTPSAPVARPVAAAPASVTAAPVPLGMPTTATTATVATQTNEPAVSSSELALLTDLRKRRLELDAREANLVTRELTLSAVEKRLAGRVDELGQLQLRLEALEQRRRDHDEANWRGLVKLYETMKPREAALIFNDLDLPVLLPVLDRMKEVKASPILAAMLPDRARQATAELAQLRLDANRMAQPAGATPTRPASAGALPSSGVTPRSLGG